uniref:Uncharacterized protein n=1 Tax=Anguilla anguilla TaxID=7936 RepID=A0A0E9WPW8_ANGAN
MPGCPRPLSCGSTWGGLEPLKGHSVRCCYMQTGCQFFLQLKSGVNLSTLETNKQNNSTQSESLNRMNSKSVCTVSKL